MFDFGLRIRELRERQKLSQEQLGRKVGRSKSVISSYENNIKIPPVEILTQLAVIFHVSLDYLVGIEKTEMLSLSGMTDRQKQALNLLSAEFRNTAMKSCVLTDRQQAIINLLFQEFSGTSR